MTGNPPLFKVAVTPSYCKNQSDPFIQKFVWSYQISISNISDQIVQILNRYWLITDMSGKTEEIQGVGVIGQQPLIKPGKNFIYTSFCQLSTPQGTMEGQYEIQNLEEEHFMIEIPKFILIAPTSVTEPFRSKLH